MFHGLLVIRYAKSRPNGKLLYNSIINGPYVRRMIPEPGDQNREVHVPKTFHEQINDELTEAKIKQMEADDQEIQTILLGLPEDIYAAFDSCETAQEMWLRVQQTMKGSDIGIQKKKAKLFNEWKRFTSTDGESIESYYHRFSMLMNDFKRNKHFPEKIARNLKFLNNLQPKWSRHEVDDLKAERLAKTYDLLALMENSNNPFNYLVFPQDQPSSSTYMQQPLPNNNNYNPQPSFNQNYMQQPMPNPEDITDPTTAMNMILVLMDKAFKLNYSTPTKNNQRISSNPRNRQIAQPVQNVENQVIQNAVQNLGVQNVKNQNGLIVVPGIANPNPNRNGNVVAARAEVRPKRSDAAYLQTQLLIAQKEEAGIQLQAEEFDLMAAVADLDKIEKVNANCIFMANLQQASISRTQTDKALVYDSDGSAEYTELLDPTLEPHQVQHNDSNVISEVSSVEQDGETIDQHLATVEETRAYFESLYNNLAIEVEESLYNGKVLLEKHDPPAVYDSEESLQLAQERLQSLAKEAHESLAKHKALELEINRLLRAIFSQYIMSIVQNNSVVDTSNLQTELERTKERFENCIIKKENEYAKLWNDWYKKCEECKYDKILYDKAYNDMKQKIEWLQAQLGDQKGKSKDTLCVSNPLDPLSQKLENKNVELEFQVRNYKKENAHLKTTYKNLFDSISVTRAQTKTIIDSLQDKLHDTIYENAKLRAHLFDKVSEQKDTTKGVDNTAKTKRPQSRSNTKNDRVPSTSKSSCSKNTKVKVEEHPRNLLLYKNKKHMSHEYNNVKLAIQNDKSEVVCAMCKQCLITANHDVCVLNYVNDMNSRGKKQKANVSNTKNQKKQKPTVMKPKKVGSNERLASPKPSKPRSCLRWSPTRRFFDLKGKIIASSKSTSQSALIMIMNSWILKTCAKEFCPPVFTSSASIENHVSKSNQTNVYLLAYLINGLRFA
uniref:Gag-Pol polyprotein n=2 Tax=Tanacetum cinerariifolium TaxID=118510 RepID=A0A6L2LQH6_TANCI|nr:hypothetical protein [Tanacetum cinerariifolium]